MAINPHAIANNIQAARQDPMFAVIGGDLGYDNGKSVAISLAFLRNYSQHMVGRDGRLIPMVACIGNHEVDGGYNQPRGKAPFFYALFDGLYPETGFATLDFGDYLSLVLLDTGHTSPIGGAQADWLDKTLKSRAEHPNVFVVNHVPAYSSFRKMGTRATSRRGQPQALGAAVPEVPRAGRARASRPHLQADPAAARRPAATTTAFSISATVPGGDSAPRRNPKSWRTSPPASRDYHLSLHRIQGKDRFHLALDERGRVMDICRSKQRRTGAVSVSE